MGKEIINILLDLNKNEKTTIVMVTHDSTMAGMTERTIRLFDGRQVN
jgi:putative ABC transport system ATP-binding protein